jgi:dUTP pyrophosphatase
MKLKIKKLHPNAVIPKQTTELAGGWDVTCTEIVQESPDFIICKLGFALQPLAGYRVILVPRSSFTKTRWVMQNSPGTGDADYLGEYQYRLRALPIRNNVLGTAFEYPEVPFKVGDRIGQIYLEEVIPIEFEEVEELTETERGNNGFGSTGK